MNKTLQGIFIGLLLLLMVLLGLLYFREQAPPPQAPQASTALQSAGTPPSTQASLPPQPLPAGIQSPSVLMLARSDKRVVFSKDADTLRAPASLVKALTVYHALQAIENLGAPVQLNTEAYLKMVEKNASMAGFYGEEQLTFRDLLYGTLLASGGEAATSLAIELAGSEAQFVQGMQARARQMGMRQSQIKNVTGLDEDGMLSTAREWALFLDQALDDPDFYAIFTSDSYLSSKNANHPDGILIQSTVLSKLDPQRMQSFQIIGGKSGTTLAAGQCWATLGRKAGAEYILVLMGADLGSFDHPNHYQIEDSYLLFEALRP